MKVTIERLSALATVSRHETVVGVTPQMIHEKCLEAKKNPRKRESLVLHRDSADSLQRMLNCIEPGSYVRPHRHNLPPKAETVVLLRGAVAFVTFLEDGTPDIENFVFLHPTRGSLIVDCREGVWHTFFALEPDTAVFEAKTGPYDAATDKQFAPWPPEENAADAKQYLESLEQIFRRTAGAVYDRA